MTKSTHRPSVDAELYQIAEKHCIGENKSPNKCFEEAFELIFLEDGSKIDGINRLNTYAEENDLDPSIVLQSILLEILDSDGEANIKFKGKLGLE